MEQRELDKIKQLYDLYEQPMYRIAFAVLHDVQLAEDAVSDAFIRLMKQLDRLGDADSPKTKAYVVKVIKSTSVSIYRRRKRKHTHEQPIDETVMQIPDRTQPPPEEMAHEPLLAGMNEDDRKLLQLRHLYGYSWREVAEQMSLSEAAVRKRYERAKRRLEKLKGEFYNEN